MLNSFNNKQNRLNDPSYMMDYKEKSTKIQSNSVINPSTKIQSNSEINEYNNAIYYPLASKEWSTSVYSYNKSYSKLLISLDAVVNKLFKSYCNMLEDKIKILFKRRRDNKIRYSADKIYVSRAELDHTNTDISMTFYLYNKKKVSIEQIIRKFITWIIFIKDGKKKIPNHDNRLLHNLKNNYLTFYKWNIIFFKSISNVLKYLAVNFIKNSHNIPGYTIWWWKKILIWQNNFLTFTKKLNFNIATFNDTYAKWRNLGIYCLVEKSYNKNVQMELVELKSIDLNSDVFSSAVALKLRDRKNKVVRILRKAILQMVRIPYLHTLITWDDNTETMDKNNITKTIKQPVVSGVRFEASGRLTRRLTAMRAVFKYRYAGSLKNIRSSFNGKSSTMLRGYVKSNSQNTLINSKTRNGTFGLKCWVSSHSIFNIIINHIGIVIRKDLRRLFLNYVVNRFLSKSYDYKI
jgi:hypothetical protein